MSAVVVCMGVEVMLGLTGVSCDSSDARCETGCSGFRARGRVPRRVPCELLTFLGCVSALALWRRLRPRWRLTAAFPASI